MATTVSSWLRGAARRLLPRRPDPTSLEAALGRQQHVRIGTVIDVGASNGCWSKRVMPFFPDARYLLVEAQAHPHEPELVRFRQQHPTADFVIAAAGAAPGTLYFDGKDPFGGQVSATPFASDNLTVPVTTIDQEVASRHLPGPYLLKLDTHGYELPIFEGATQTLAQAALIVVEVYNFEIVAGCLRFHEMCAYLEKRGFGCLDLFDIMHRPGDRALWQMDMVFAPLSRPEFQRRTYE